jgi:aryl-alcohol dehydrogenase-like predicted oxidoreductase
MGMSDLYGPADDAESIRTIHAALDRGVTLLDTGDYYAAGQNELLVGRAIKGRRDQALVSVKFGVLRTPEGGWGGVDGRPAAVKNFAAMSLVRLGTDHIDIYRLGRLDPNVPIEDTVGAIADLVRAGHVRAIGLSEVGPETIRRAAKVHAIADLQIEYSLVSRDPETAIFPVLEELGIGLTAYGVLSRGLLTGSRPGGPGDIRGHLPRFQPENLARNEALVDALGTVARDLGATAAQVAIAWVLAQRPWIVPLVGARRVAQIDDALGAVDLELSANALARIEAALPRGAVAGTRYGEEQMRILDSERA